MPSPDLLTRYRYTWATLPGIEPVDGWTLLVRDFQDGEGYWYPEYIAVRGEWEREFHVSRHGFQFTQARFAFLIANPARPAKGNWTDADIDAAMAGEMAA